MWNLRFLFSRTSFLESSPSIEMMTLASPPQPPWLQSSPTSKKNSLSCLMKWGKYSKRHPVFTSHLSMPLLRLSLQAWCLPPKAGWLCLCMPSDKIPVHSVSLGTRGVQAGLFSTDPFLWTVSLRAVKKKNSDKLWVVIWKLMGEVWLLSLQFNWGRYL